MPPNDIVSLLPCLKAATFRFQQCLQRALQAQVQLAAIPAFFTFESDLARRNRKEHMLLQLCLYSTELFQFEGAFTQDNGQTRPGNRQIQDVRTAQRRTCQNRSKLVEVLADIVMTYDSNCAQLYVAEPYLLAAQTHKALHHIQAILGSPLPYVPGILFLKTQISAM